jgi:hypothetical protein
MASGASSGAVTPDGLRRGEPSNRMDGGTASNHRLINLPLVMERRGSIMSKLASRILVAILIIIISTCALHGCSDYTINTVDELYLDQEALEAKHKKWWAFFFGVRVDRNAIREDIALNLDKVAARKFNAPNQEWAWRETTHLHLLNPASVFAVDQAEFVKFIRSNLKAFEEDKADKLYSLVGSYFDDVIIHYYDNPDGIGLKWEDKTIVLATNRREIFGKMKTPALRKLIERSDF